MKQRLTINLTWAGLLVLTVAIVAVYGSDNWLVKYPTTWVVPFTPALNAFMTWFIAHFGAFFKAFAYGLGIVMDWVRQFMNWLPWSITLTVVTVSAYFVAGRRLAIFSFFAIFYMALIGYWPQSMNSLSLVLISVPLAVAIGLVFGALGFLSVRARMIILPLMDLFQTIPAFAYLLPILLLFGFGPVVGLIASIMFAFPPTVRNTIVGLSRVPDDVIEAALISGATGRQMFWRVRLPIAKHQILLGVNQTTMAAFSMVIVASIIGGTADIGWEVLSTMRKAEFGQSLLAGMVIALMAMVMDRMTAAAADSGLRGAGSGRKRGFWARYWKWCAASALVIAVALLSRAVPGLDKYPSELQFYPANYLNDMINYVIVGYAGTIKEIKNIAFFFAMLPVKIGLIQTISPFTWGFEFTDRLKMVYLVAIAVVALVLAVRGKTSGTIAFVFGAILVYFGLTKLPWPPLVAMVTLLGWQLGGVRLALGSFLGLAFLLTAGIWPPAVISVYLCGLAVLLSFSVGAFLGILASESDLFSKIIRPFNDTLQTMPLFVILIPFVMIFHVGEFTALLAIIAYSIVPAIRYTEHALRNIPSHITEAATSMGCTRLQLLWRVKLPLALPVMMLGLNQTIIFAISMLVIAALVGTNGLGQSVYIGLGNGDFGVGIVAGFGMAVIAMIADRITQAWSRRKQESLGLNLS